MKVRAWHLPVRLATGAFILNSGLSKWQQGDEERDKQIHAMATGTYPFFESMEPGQFTRLLAAGEIALGAGLLAVPVVGPGIAGLGLSGFSAALLGLYMKTPGMREPDSIRPSSTGLPIAKDSWILAIGAGLVMDAAGQRLRRLLPGRRS